MLLVLPKGVSTSRIAHRALESAEGVRQFKDAVADFGLGYQETVERNVTVRAYDGSSDLRSARVAE